MANKPQWGLIKGFWFGKYLNVCTLEMIEGLAEIIFINVKIVQFYIMRTLKAYEKLME